MEPDDCPLCKPAGGRRRMVDPACPEHGIPVSVGAMCRCLGCCCKDGSGHKHPDYLWWAMYAAHVWDGESDMQARTSADIDQGRRCDPAGTRHSTPHVGCIMR